MLILEEELLTLTSPVLDLDVSTMTRRMNPNGFCVVNSPKRPAALKGDVAGTTITVDATKISVDHLGSPFLVNVAIIGAYLAVRKSLLIEEVEEAIKNFINPRGHRIFDGKRGEMNLRALRAGYKSAKA